MGGWDSYCFICGGYARVSATAHAAFQESPDFDEEKSKPFFFDQDDIAFHEDLVSVGPYSADKERKPLIDHMKINYRVPDADESARLAALDPSTDIRLVDGLVAGGFHDMGGLGLAPDRGKDPNWYNTDAKVYPFGHALCFKLLEGFTPRLTNPIGNFWQVVRAQNGTNPDYTIVIHGVDYGDISKAMEQYVRPYREYEYDEKYPDNSWLPPKLVEVMKKDVIESADVDDFWLGTGKMYVWKKPDRFPIPEAFAEDDKLWARDGATAPIVGQEASLPGLSVEILLQVARHLPLRDALKLLELNYQLRLKLLASVDTLVKQQLEPWAFPTPKEQDLWDSLISSEVGVDFPWRSYARACGRSASMWNRRRIYGICQQLEELAERHSII